MITLAAGVRISPHPSGAIALDTRSGKIFSANLVGARILELIHGGCNSREQIESMISTEFGIAPDVARTDITRFMEALESQGLLQN